MTNYRFRSSLKCNTLWGDRWMANKYSKLLFDSSKIYDWINQWCELNLEGESEIQKIETNQRISYTILNNDKEIKIDFIKAKGGALTIFPKVGKNVDVSELIAEDIYGRVHSALAKSPFANGFSIKMPYDDFRILIDLLNEYNDITLENYSKQDETGKPAYELYRFRSAFNDTVVIKYFNNTKRVQIQGKPLYLFNEITSLICQSEKNADSVVDAHIELCNLKLERSELNDELMGILGVDVYNFMTTTHRAMFNTSVILSKVKIEGLDDYSYILQQALRTYEGLTLKMLSAKGCVLPPKKQIGEFFTRLTANDDFTMKPTYSGSLDTHLVKIFEDMYNFYHSKRHPYMHSSDSDVTTTIIGTYEGALERLEEIIHNMKMNYSKYMA